MVRCPHCSAEQQEPELVKSTFCRKCSEHFVISAANLAGAPPVPKPAPLKTRKRPPAEPAAAEVVLAAEPALPPAAGVAVPEALHAGTGLLHKIDGLFATKPKHRIAQCFDCSSAHEVHASAQSSTCKSCGAYIDLQDHKIAGAFSRTIKTRGDVYLGPKGDLSSSKIFCRDAVVQGKMRGNMVCTGRLTVKFQGDLTGSVQTAELFVEKGSDATFARPVKLLSAEIHGKVSGQFQVESHVTVCKHGALHGPVQASAFSVDKGGVFEGDLTIAPRKHLTVGTPAAEAGGPEQPAVQAGSLQGREAA